MSQCVLLLVSESLNESDVVWVRERKEGRKEGRKNERKKKRMDDKSTEDK